jgi:hypothetical protein
MYEMLNFYIQSLTIELGLSTQEWHVPTDSRINLFIIIKRRIL